MSKSRKTGKPESRIDEKSERQRDEEAKNPNSRRCKERTSSLHGWGRRAGWIALAVLIAVEALWAWPWSRDMILQPIVRPLLVMLQPAPGTVSLGSERPMTLEVADRTLRSPLQATAENLAAGKKLYDVYCAVCHGATGLGDGPVAGGALAPANLANPLIQQKSDGHFYAVIRNGLRGMPQYHEALTAQERWQVVLYLRVLPRGQSAGVQRSP